MKIICMYDMKLKYVGHLMGGLG